MLTISGIELTSAIIVTALSVIAVFLMCELKKQNDIHTREKLRIIVSYFRLNKMLSLLGVNIDNYIHQVPTQDISRHIANCHRCPNTITCDKCLLTGKVVGDIQFCPNHQSLVSYAQKLEHNNN